MPLDTVRLSWSVDEHGMLVACNDPFCRVMGYTRVEITDHPGTRLLRPHSDGDDPDIVAIWQAKQRLERRETLEEHISSWIETRDGTRVETPTAVMTYNSLYRIWDVVADVSIEHLAGPQFKTPWEQLALQGHLVHDLILKVEDLRAQVARVPTEEDWVLEAIHASGAVSKPRKQRSDTGTRDVLADDFDIRLHSALEIGLATVNDVLRETRVGSRATLQKYLQPYCKNGRRETPLQTIKRLGHEWYPDRYLM